jgi:hypothetical protein
LDPYTYTMEDLRRTIIRIVRRRVEKEYAEHRRVCADRGPVDNQ